MILQISCPAPGPKVSNFFPFRPGMAPGGLGTPKIDHEPYIRTIFPSFIKFNCNRTIFRGRGVGGPMYAIVYPAQMGTRVGARGARSGGSGGREPPRKANFPKFCNASPLVARNYQRVLICGATLQLKPGTPPDPPRPSPPREGGERGRGDPDPGVETFGRSHFGIPTPGGGAISTGGVGSPPVSGGGIRQL